MIFNTHLSTNDPNAPIYEIRLQGHLHPRWTTELTGMKITLESDGNTLLTGPIVDQSALYGILRKLRDIGIPLLSVFCIDPKK
jgi:hypothetical protein